jgi:2-keto-3-deoxy-L-rhamnonate aldolase RhmA
MKPVFVTSAAVLVALVVMPTVTARQEHENVVIDLWMQGKPAFGVFVPNENVAQRPPGQPPTGASGATAGAGGGPSRGGPQSGARPKPLYTRAGGEKLAANPLYDYVFLNLEGSYDGEAVKAIAEGLRSPGATSRKTLIVRIPAYHDAPDQSRARVREIFAAGADGITFPHVENLDEARRILDLFQQEKVNVWSPANPRAERLAMLMIEDPVALAQATELANLKGYSILACGIGSLTQALMGDRDGAEAGTQKILAETKRVKLVNMLTATTQDVEKRVKEGFLGILAQGQNPDEAIRIGRALVGR